MCCTETTPHSPTEVAIIVDSRNRLSISTLDALGISYTYNKQEDTVVYDDISFEDILNKTFKVVFNDDYFVKNTNSFGTYYTTIDSIADAETKQNTLSEIYNSDRSYTLNVVGVLRINETLRCPCTAQESFICRHSHRFTSKTAGLPK